MGKICLIRDDLEGTGDIDKSTYENCYSVHKEQIKLSGMDAFKYSNIIKSDTGDCSLYSAYARHTKHIVINHNGQIYNIVYSDNQNSELKDQILSTFKFTQ